MTIQWRVILLPVYNYAGDYIDDPDPEYFYFDSFNEAEDFCTKKSSEVSLKGQKLYLVVPPFSVEVIL